MFHLTEKQQGEVDVFLGNDATTALGVILLGKAMQILAKTGIRAQGKKHPAFGVKTAGLTQCLPSFAILIE